MIVERSRPSLPSQVPPVPCSPSTDQATPPPPRCARTCPSALLSHCSVAHGLGMAQNPIFSVSLGPRAPHAVPLVSHTSLTSRKEGNMSIREAMMILLFNIVVPTMDQYTDINIILRLMAGPDQSTQLHTGNYLFQKFWVHSNYHERGGEYFSEFEDNNPGKVSLF